MKAPWQRLMDWLAKSPLLAAIAAFGLVVVWAVFFYLFASAPWGSPG